MAKQSKPKSDGKDEPTPSQAFAVPAGPVDVTSIDTESAPIGPQSKSDAADAMVELTPRLAELQGRLYAQSTAGGPRSVLLILQGMDTAGKDGVISSVLGMVDPDGAHFATFKKPTPEELAHDFLWRIEKHRETGSRTRVHRRVQSVPVRGRPRCQGARAGAGRRLVPAVFGDQRIRAAI